MLYSIKLRWGGEDKLCWAPSKIGLFDVRSFYNILAPHDNDSFPWKSIWQSKVPLKVTFFAWSAALGKIPTLDNLKKRHLIVVDCCCMCKKSEESVDHLLLHCETAYAFMEFYFQPLWVKVGHASGGSGSLRLLDRAILFFSKYNSVEDDPILFNVVYKERKKNYSF
jgi:hypothetical protein